jgi:hypothetical protein
MRVEVLLVAGMLLIGSVSAVAQDRAGVQPTNDCFTVVMTTKGSAGSILLNKCTGQSWLLVTAQTKLGNSPVTTLRWFPISVEKNEVLVPAN